MFSETFYYDPVDPAEEIMAKTTKKKASKSDKEKKPPVKRHVPRGKASTRQIIIPGPDDLNQPSDDLHDYTILLMGAKNAGKTSASASFPQNLNFQWEPYRKNVRLRMIGADKGLIYRTAEEIMEGAEDPWILFQQYLAYAVDDPTVNTGTWDTVDIAYNACFESVCARLGVHHPNEISDDYGNSWKMIQNEFLTTLNTVKGMGMGTLFVSHTKEREIELKETREGTESEMLIGPSCQPACINILKSVCDFWFYYGWHNGKRRLYLRDPEKYVDVACGTGFVDDEGNALEYIDMPEGEPDQFYPILNHAFRTGKIQKQFSSAAKKKAAKKKATKKKASR